MCCTRTTPQPRARVSSATLLRCAIAPRRRGHTPTPPEPRPDPAAALPWRQKTPQGRFPRPRALLTPDSAPDTVTEGKRISRQLPPPATSVAPLPLDHLHRARTDLDVHSAGSEDHPSSRSRAPFREPPPELAAIPAASRRRPSQASVRIPNPSLLLWRYLGWVIAPGTARAPLTGEQHRAGPPPPLHSPLQTSRNPNNPMGGLRVPW